MARRQISPGFCLLLISKKVKVRVAALKTLWLWHTRELIEAGDFLSPVESEKTHFVENSAAWRKRRIFAERVRGFCGKRKTQYSARAPEQKMGTIETFPGAIGRHISPSTPERSREEFTNILHTSTKHLCATYISKIFQGNTEPTNTSSFQYIGIYSIDTHMLPLPLHLGHRLLQRELLAGRVGDLLQPLSQLVNPSISNKIDQNRNKRVAVMQS